MSGDHRYFSGLTKEKIEDALRLSAQLKSQGVELHTVTKSAGVPKDHYIWYDGELHPLKAVIKKAMELSAIDPASLDRKGFTSHRGRAWLEKLGFEWEQIESTHAETINEVERQRSLISVLARPNQTQFRYRVGEAFDWKCALTDNGVRPALEACHILPIKSGGPDDVDNGILLRADLHRLYDLHLVAICPQKLVVKVASEVLAAYKNLENMTVKLPSANQAHLNWRWEIFNSQIAPNQT
ncbi:HNH endonuclease [Actibacterium lipolyticum]|uniref:HNH nuclease domain-containing protein n=1 Tax=Actibacterium lipolyticum TaxID=1524263 RepID=A0A238JQ55_9RHOB|nr:HNH endonuclease [Actibacterium lipolyticum]SMX32800.1 hypothetical protein COL8621_00895 [Actibacterium lipolyticum]